MNVPSVVRYHTDDAGSRVVLLCKQGTKWVHGVVQTDAGLEVVHLPLDAKVRELDYPVKRAVKLMKEHARAPGRDPEISKEIKALLTRAIIGATL